MNTTDSVTDNLISAADDFGPLIDANRPAIARGPDLPPEVAQALETGGFTRLWLPRTLGGLELPPVEYFRVIEAISRHDGSVGWCAAIASTGVRAAGLIQPQSAADLLGDSGFVAGSLSPTGAATRESSGWNINGRWPWGSFIRYSKVTLAMCIEYEGSVARTLPEGGPLLRVVLLPTEQVKVLQTWEGTGLRSSGSHDFAIDNVFVPDEHTFALPRFEAIPHQPGALYALPFITMFALGITAVSLGIARGSIDALIMLAQNKTATGTTGLLREQTFVQSAVAKAETMLRSARAFLFSSVQDLWDAENANRPADMTQRALARMASGNVVQVAKTVTDLMYATAGGSAVHERSLFGTYLRDAQVASQHLAFSPRNLETSGRILLGMDAGTPRF